MNNTNNGITGIVPFSYFLGAQKKAGSTFLRVDGLTANAADFECYQHGRKYDNLIFQKAYWIEMMEFFEGPKLLDLCDPDWINTNIDIIALSSHVHAITCSSPGLTELVKRMLPNKMVFHVPDRLNFQLFPETGKTHSGQAKKAVWFGFVHNAYETLPQLLPSIIKYDLELTIIADKPYSQDDEIKKLNPHFNLYNQSTAYNLISEADIVLNPRSAKALYKYKSNNKSIIGWKLGLPVALSNEDIDRFMDPEERNKEAREMKKLVEAEYNILQSAQEYRKIFSLIKTKAKITV
jgi:hypothetical protein